jgi:hypothetical protein
VTRRVYVPVRVAENVTCSGFLPPPLFDEATVWPAGSSKERFRSAPPFQSRLAVITPVAATVILWFPVAVPRCSTRPPKVSVRVLPLALVAIGATDVLVGGTRVAVAAGGTGVFVRGTRVAVATAVAAAVATAVLVAGTDVAVIVGGTAVGARVAVLVAAGAPVVPVARCRAAPALIRP